VISGQIWVPRDDASCWVYSYVYAESPETQLSPDFLSLVLTAWGCHPEQRAPDFVHTRNVRNDYLIDRDLQKTSSFSGLVGMNVQDFAVQEGMGPICDRSKEHLAGSDHVIVAVRRLLFEGMDALDAGTPLRGTHPDDYRMVRGSDQFVEHGSNWRDALGSDLVARF
jgi:phthalate 4,5-dioxygenase oxygenase subunit